MPCKCNTFARATNKATKTIMKNDLDKIKCKMEENLMKKNYKINLTDENFAYW